MPRTFLPITFDGLDYNLLKVIRDTNAVIGKDFDQNVSVSIGDNERCGGLYQLQDILGEMEAERLIRTDLLDEAALARIDERISFVEDRGRSTGAILGRAAAAILGARMQTGKMQSILDMARNLRESIREINRFFTTVMEGKTAQGREDFSAFLIARVRASSGLPKEYLELVELYVSLKSGIHIFPGLCRLDLRKRKGSFCQPSPLLNKRKANKTHG